MRLTFVGESWRGSSARSLREALETNPGVDLDEIGEDRYFPTGKSFVVRAASRILRPWCRAELEHEVAARLDAFVPDVLLVYKGNDVAATVVRRAKEQGIFTVNVFPDCSPHAHGQQLKAALAEYDLIISTKPFHPAAWGPIYGYRNLCVFVPHGYDPAVHLWTAPPDPSEQIFDVVMVSNWRPEYHRLAADLGERLEGQHLHVALAGPGWIERSASLPKSWHFAPALHGRAYGEFLRQGKAVVAPVTREVVIKGVSQPGDEDTTRTYELAAAGCFFLHRRTPFACTLYDPDTEVPMWDDANELAELIAHYVPLSEKRAEMAARAHARAVPHYSIPERAREMLKLITTALHERERERERERGRGAVG